MAIDVQTTSYILKVSTQGIPNADKEMTSFVKHLEGLGYTVTKTAEKTGALGIDIGKLAARAAITIPVWLALRTAFMETLRTIGDGAKSLVEFDAALRRMQAVTSGVADVPNFMKLAGEEVRNLSVQTGRSVKEISDIYYQFAETGMKATDALAGMSVALKVTIGTFGDAKETARMMVDLFNMFGTSMDKSMSSMQKMQMIGGTFISLWKQNSGTLTEYINGLKMFAPVAKNYNLSMQETLTTVVALNNYMQRGTMGGTQLARAFNEIQKNASKFDQLGLNVRNRTDGMQLFLDVLKKINTMPVGQKGSLINALFGERSQRGVSALSDTTALTKVITELERTRNLTIEQATRLIEDSFNLQNKKLENQIAILDVLRRRTGEAFVIGLLGAKDYNDAVEKGGEALQKLNSFMKNTLIPTMKAFGNAIYDLFHGPAGWIVGLVTVAALLRSVPALFTAINAHPIIAIITALTTLLTLYHAAKNQAITEATEAAKSGQSYEQYYRSRNKKVAESKKPVFSVAGLIARNWETAIPIERRKSTSWWSGLFDDPFEAQRKKAFEAAQQEAAIQRAAQASAQQTKQPTKVSLTPEQRAEASLQTQIAYTDRLKAYGYDMLQIEMAKYAIMEKEGVDALKLEDQKLKILQAQLAVVNEYADIMKTKLTGAFSDILSGKAGLGGVWTAFNNSLVEGFRKSVSEGLTNVVMSTGIGELFGVSMSSIKTAFGGIAGKIEGAFDAGGKITYNWIIRAFSDAQTGRATSGGNVARFASSGVAGFSGVAGGMVGGLLSSGWFSQPLMTQQTAGGQPIQVLYGAGTGGHYVYGKTNASKDVVMTKGQLAYAGLQSVMTGYSAYQSARAGGQSPGLSMGAGIFGGLGGLAGGISGGLFASGAALSAPLLSNPIGWAVLAGALIVGSIFMSSMGKKKATQTSIETKTTESQVASKIDVSNKKLELINRNLVALRNTMETYILPSSAYFSTARNLEDEFSISARRG